uniref:Fibroblast growth factor receptor-like 1 n=1 Tax=Rhabditophanes sp. KR3021 TaxID=114890 RepID=A0AC35U6G7_9BILA
MSMRQFKFTCPIQDVDDTSIIIQWNKDGELIEPSYNNRFKTVKSGKELRIKNIEIADSGHYQCVIINGWGHARNNFTFIVYDEDDEYLGEDERIVLSDYEAKPSWTHPQDIHANSDGYIMPKINGDLDLSCAGKGNPFPSIQWYKNSEKIDLDYAHQSIVSAKFVLHNVQVTDSGIYECSLYNKHGHINATFKVVIEDKRIGNYPSNELGGVQIETTDKMNDKVNSSIIDIPSNKSVHLGNTAEFECKVKWVEGMPLTRWFKKIEKDWTNPFNDNTVLTVNNMDLLLLENKANQSVVIINNQKMVVNRLTLPNVLSKDEGTYVCVVSDGGNLIQRSVMLSIYGESKMSVFDDNLKSYLKIGVVSFFVFIVICTLAILYLKKTTTNNDCKEEDRLTLSPPLITAVIRPPPPKMAPPKTPKSINDTSRYIQSYNETQNNNYTPIEYHVPWNNVANIASKFATMKQLSPSYKQPYPIHRTVAEDALSHVYDETATPQPTVYWSHTLPGKYKNDGRV